MVTFLSFSAAAIFAAWSDSDGDAGIGQRGRGAVPVVLQHQDGLSQEIADHRSASKAGARPSVSP